MAVVAQWRSCDIYKPQRSPQEAQENIFRTGNGISISVSRQLVWGAVIGVFLVNDTNCPCLFLSYLPLVVKYVLNRPAAVRSVIIFDDRYPLRYLERVP